MLLYICPKCGLWLNYALAQSLINALNKAFKTSTEVQHQCPECKVEMVSPHYRDRLIIMSHKGLMEMLRISNEETKTHKN